VNKGITGLRAKGQGKPFSSLVQMQFKVEYSSAGLAEKIGLDMNRIHVPMEVNTEVNPHYWKTVASMATVMVGNAVLEAAEDVLRQLKHIAAVAMRCSPGELEVGGGKVYLKSDPDAYLDLEAIAHGYSYPGGNSIGGPIIGRGNFIMPRLTYLDKETGEGKAGPGWTVGAQAVEVEFDTKDFVYKVLKAVTVLDAGKVINPMSAKGVVMGGMSMGLGYGSREALVYSDTGVSLNPQLRTYKLMRFGEHPEYLVDFVETPFVGSPYGARGFGEHGILGMPAALANALSCASQVELNQLPLTPEVIWKAKGGYAE